MGKLNRKETVAIIGLGYVGLPLALLAERKGYRVIGVDVNENKVQLLSQRKPVFHDEQIAEALRKSTFEATTDFQKIAEASLIVICVPTPVYENHMPDLRPVESAAKGIAPFLQKGQTVILESTINPGVSETFVLPILEQGSGLKAGVGFYLAHCPERINPGDQKWNVENIPRVIGSLEPKGLDVATKFYRSVLVAPVKQMNSLKEAEAVKVVENSFRDINIAFVNELAMSFSHLGIDVTEVIAGAATKPFSFLAHLPGCGVGGHCIPVDPYYLIEYAKKNGFEHDFLSLARRINNQMPRFCADLVFKSFNEKRIPLNGSKVAVLGLSYKADIDDDRESPSYHTITYLKEFGAKVAAYDPFVARNSNVESLQEALSGAKAAVITTAHSLFRALKPVDFVSRNIPIVVDGRNCLSKKEFVEAGLLYKGIGR